MARHRVVLARHGETEGTMSEQHTSRTDVPLTATGVDEARAMGVRLAHHSFALVLTSPLGRARDTCRLAGLGDEAVASDDVVEWDYGEYEGRTTAEIRADEPGWSLWRDGAR